MKESDLDHAFQRLAVESLVLLLDVAEVDLTAADDDADQSCVISAEPCHCVVQLLRVECQRILDTLHCNPDNNAGQILPLVALAKMAETVSLC